MQAPLPAPSYSARSAASFQGDHRGPVPLTPNPAGRTAADDCSLYDIEDEPFAQ